MKYLDTCPKLGKEMQISLVESVVIQDNQNESKVRSWCMRLGLTEQVIHFSIRYFYINYHHHYPIITPPLHQITTTSPLSTPPFAFLSRLPSILPPLPPSIFPSILPSTTRQNLY